MELIAIVGTSGRDLGASTAFCLWPNATYLFSAVHRFQRIERDRLLLATHRQGTQRATRHTGGKRADALNQRRSRQHAATGVTARFLYPRGCVHGVADQRDLLLKIVKLPNDDRTAMKPGAKIGAAAKIALVGGAARGEAVMGDETGAHAASTVQARLGEVHFLDFLNRFITDLSLAIAETGGEIHKYAGDEIIATWTLAALGNCGGRAHIDEQQHALLKARVVITPGDKGEEYARAKQIVDAQQEIVAEAGPARTRRRRG